MHRRGLFQLRLLLSIMVDWVILANYFLTLFFHQNMFVFFLSVSHTVRSTPHSEGPQQDHAT